MLLRFWILGPAQQQPVRWVPSCVTRARREEGVYRAYSTDEQQSHRGAVRCPADRLFLSGPLGAIAFDEDQRALEIRFDARIDARIVIARCDHRLERQASRGGASGRALGEHNAGVVCADTSEVDMPELLHVGQKQSKRIRRKLPPSIKT